MPRAGKTFLLVLLTKLAALGSATVALKGWSMPTAHTKLMGLKAAKSASASRVIAKVAALLEAHHDASAVAHEIDTATESATPGAMEALKAVLEEAVSELESQVMPLITAGHDATQAEINQKVEDLAEANVNLNSQKEAADAADSEWMQCVEDEKGMAKGIEDATAALEEARNSRNASCQLREDHSVIDAAMEPEALRFDCDISLSPEHNCDVQWQEFEHDVEEAWAALAGAVDADVRVYEEYALACEQATAEEQAREESLRAAVEQYEEQHERCLDAHATRELAMCSFETKFGQKCDLATSYHDLVAETEAVGSDRSQPDRVQEWTTVSTAACFMRRIIDTSVADATHVSECEAGVSTDHLTLDVQRQLVAELTATPNYDCTETTITFLGETWEIPSSAVPPAPSASYQRAPFHPEFPFSFCEKAGKGN